jgi:hypothetical protein
MSSNEILLPVHRSNQQHVRQGNDYQNVTVADGGRAVLGNVYAENFSMNILDHSQRPQKTEQQKKDDLMKSLGFDVMDSRLATIGIAYRETCSWLYTRAEYLRWQDPESRAENHGFMWIRGKPGTGKSTLIKHALRHAQSLGSRDTTTLSFFFNARGHALAKTTEGMYRSLLHQVYTTFPDRLPGSLPNHSTDPSKHTWQLPILQTMLRDALLNFGATAEFICYIDALDECAEDDIRLAVEFFEELGELAISQDVKLSICFVSRHYPNITMQCCQTLNLDKLKEHHEDIRNFVKGKLRSPGITSLTHAELTAEISGRSSGVFLWAALVVQLLNKKMDGGANRSQLIADLKAVPAGIEDLLKSILTDGSEFLLPTLVWVLFSFELLSASGLHLAIKIGAGHLTPEDLDQTETTQEQMHLFILESSKGLVEFSKGYYPRAQFIHESVREHLINGGLSVLDDSLAENLEAKSHLRLAVWCQNCIELDPHHGLLDAVDAKRLDYTLVYYALGSLYAHCEWAFDGGVLQLEFLDTIPQSIQSRIVCYHAKPGLLELLLDDEQRCVCLVEGLLRRQLRVFGQVDASSRARNDAIEGFIPYFDVDDDAVVMTLLLSAIILCLLNRRSLKVVQLLLDCGADFDLECFQSAPLLDRMGTSILVLAVGAGSPSLIQLLIDGGADIDAIHSTRGTALMVAAESGDFDIVRLLIDNNAKVNESGVAHTTALIMAAKSGVVGVVEILLDAGADVNAIDTTHRTALIIAAEMGNFDIARLLVARGANLDMHGHEGVVLYLRIAEEDALAGHDGCDRMSD